LAKRGIGSFHSKKLRNRAAGKQSYYQITRIANEEVVEEKELAVWGDILAPSYGNESQRWSSCRSDCAFEFG